MFHLEAPPYMNPLIKLEKARQQIAECRNLNEAKGIRDKAAAAEVYCRKAKLGLAAQNDCAEIKIRAERQAGKLLKKLEKGRGPGRGKKKITTDGNLLSEYAKALESADASQQEGTRWQQAAELPEGEFEAHVAEVRADDEELTSAGVLRAAKNLTSDSPDYDGDEWYTPGKHIELAREVLGVIDLDPASHEAAQGIVKATKYYTSDDDGLSHPWRGRVFLNPPYSQPLVSQFTDKLLAEFEAGRTIAAVLLVNNCTDTAWFQALLKKHPVCFTAGRIKFEHPERRAFATRQGQAFFYLGPNRKQFIKVFSKAGTVVGVL